MHSSGLCRINQGVNAVDLASLLCSRLCHDLLSPVGALNNGLELMADEQDPEMRERCLELLNESARASANKLKFFRLAFGAAGGFGDQIDTREAKAALEGLFGADKRVELGWVVADDELPKGAVKLLLNLALIAGDALVRGGRLDVGAERGGGLELVIRAEGPRILLDPTLRETILTGGSTQIPAILTKLRALFPAARFVDTDAFGSVGLGLALDARRKFG